MSIITALRDLSDSLEQIEQNSQRLEQLETKLKTLNGDTADYGTVDLLEDDQRQTGLNNQSGIRIEMSETVEGISARISPRTRGVSKAYLRRDEGGEILEEIDLDEERNYRPGDWAYFGTTLSKGEAYEIVFDSEGRNFTRGRANGVEYPITGTALDVTHGIYSNGGARSESYRYCVDRLAPGQDFRDRERTFGVLNDVPRDATIVYAQDELDLDGDVGAELQSFINGLDTVNHAILLPDELLQWDTHVKVPSSAEFFGLVGDGYGPLCKIKRSIDHPLTVGTRRRGVNAIVRNIDWDIREEGYDGWPVDTGFMQVFGDSWFIAENCRRLGKRQRYQWRDGKGPVDGYYRFGNAYSMLAGTLAEDGVGIVQNCLTDGGIHNTREPTNPIAERPGNSGEGVGFSAEMNFGTVYWKENVARGSVGNTFYMHSGATTEGKNVVVNNEIFNTSRSAIRLGKNDEAYDNYVEFSDMSSRYPGSGLWFNKEIPHCESLEIYSTDGNHELVRASSECAGGVIKGLEITAGPDNDHHTVRASSIPSRPIRGLVIEDFRIVDKSDGPTPTGKNYSLDISRDDVTLRNGVIDVSESPREAIGGRSEPTLENVEIID